MSHTWAPRALSLLRIFSALLFMEHGLMKLLHFPIAQAGVPSNLPPLLLIASLIEIGGGLLLTLGLFTRVVAFICSGEMASAYLIGHLPTSFWPGVNGGGEAILYAFIFLFFFTAGGGEWSLDAVLAKRLPTPSTR